MPNYINSNWKTTQHKIFPSTDLNKKQSLTSKLNSSEKTFLENEMKLTKKQDEKGKKKYFKQKRKKSF